MPDVEAMRAECFERFAEVEELFDALILLIGDSEQLVGTQRVEARERLRHLKQVLKGEVRRVKRDEESLTPVEKAFYFFSIQEASANLSTRVNTVPGRRWLEGLLWSRDDLAQSRMSLESCDHEALEDLAERLA